MGEHPSKEVYFDNGWGRGYLNHFTNYDQLQIFVYIVFQ